MDALRCPPPDATFSVSPVASAPRRAVQAAARAARPAAARRADQPPRRRERAVARAAPGEVRRHRRRGHPRPVLPRQRRAVDPRARPRPGLPLRGNYSTYLETKRLASRSRARRTPSAPSGSRTSWSGCAPTPRAGRPRARRASRVRGDGRRGRKTRKLDFEEIQIPPDPAWAASSSSREAVEGLRRPAAHRRAVLLAARNGIVGVIGPNGAERRRCSR
jgi:hypothetical protein